MKIMNAGTANFVVRDKRGNLITLEPSDVVEISEQTLKKVKIYSFIKVIEEKVEPKVEPKIEEPVVKKTKKKAK